MQLELLESFDLPAVTMPPRSRLASLQPIGVDTAYCESLISYLMRLANAHSVRPNVLVKEIIVPLTDIKLDTAIFSFCCKYSRTLNSYMYYAEAFRTALEKLTLQRNLSNLTLLPWADLFDPKGSGLLREHVGICPDCLDDLSNSHQEIYYPIIWYLRSVQFCSKHQCWLEETCSRCGKHQNFIGNHAMLGYCTLCGAWLGRIGRTRIKAEVTQSFSDRDKFMTAAVEEMIAYNSKAWQYATNAHFLDRVRRYSEILSEGNIYRFEELLGIGRGAIQSWFSKNTRPRFDKFLELCFRLGQMPIQFLTDDISDDFRISAQHLHKHHPIHKEKADLERLRVFKERLEAILGGEELPSQPVMASALGVKLRFLLYHFPDLCKAISKKRKKMIATRVALKRSERIGKAEAVTQQMFIRSRTISRRDIWAAMENEGLTFADRDVRKAALSVVTSHQPTRGDDV